MGEYSDHLSRRWSVRQIENFVADLRKRLRLEDEWTFDVLQVFWRTAKLDGSAHGIELIPRPDEYMGDKDAWATSDPPRIEIKKSKYDDAVAHQPDARFLVAHELFHTLVHEGGRKFRFSEGDQRLNFLPRDALLEVIHGDESIEVQADQAARAFLMPPHLVRQTRSPEELALRCVVPLKEARVRFAQINTGPRRTPSDLQEDIDAHRKANRALATECEDQVQRITRLAQERDQMWEKLPVIADEDPNEFRVARGWRVDRSQYLKMTQCGWKIHQGEIRSYLDLIGN